MTRQARDLIRRGAYWVAHATADAAVVLGARIAARADLLAGRPEPALLRYGQLVRHVQLARESLATYRRIDHIVRRHPDRLGDYRARSVAPERIVFFLGYSRSGHSLLAALLDAHPNVLIAHELHALKHLAAGASFAEVAAAIQYNSRFFDQFGRGYSGYSYAVAGQSQGAATDLRVIGDKKANGTARLLRRDPGLVERLGELLPAPFVFLHIVRDPLDNIASRARRTGTSLERAARGYFANAACVEDLKQRRPDAVIDVYLDDLVADPRTTLRALLGRLGVTDVGRDYLDAAAARVAREPMRSRDQVAWRPELRRQIEGRLTDYSFLRRFAGGPGAVRGL